jgi:hypothetical protein
MRASFSFAFFCLVSFVLTSCGPTPEQGKDYNNKIIDEQTMVVGKYNSFIQSVSDTTTQPDIYKKDLQDMLDQIGKSRIVLNGLDKFDEKTEFSDACLSLFAVFENVAKNELAEIISLYDKEDYNEDDRARATELFQVSDKKVQAELNSFTQFQKDFATKYNFSLE